MEVAVGIYFGRRSSFAGCISSRNFFCPKRLTFHPANICYKTLKPALALDKSLDRLFFFGSYDNIVI
ncbi:hypothetical protein Psch_03606 [Pelotomaculum schinkii]|uniref:Uncharacterized protein n=1 Tax=Pelotomaculum schinkii TaxID=78350 RepID=A0A4Y7R7A9_9FIRM|nr:hypothetical protein Psch_03606 [Pelotomaculum schinkii]